jgi:hypothetical protein
MAELPPKLQIHPPLINSASPWATTLDDLRRLYAWYVHQLLLSSFRYLGGSFI